MNMPNNEMEPTPPVGGMDLSGFQQWMATSPYAGLGVQAEEERPIPRPVRDPKTGRFVTSDEPGLVDTNGNLLRDENGKPLPYYDPGKAALEFYYGTEPEQRQYVLDVLAAKGIRTNTYESALNALGDLHSTANTFGKTVDAMLRDIVLNVPDKPTDKPARVAPTRVTSAQDLKRVVKAVSRSVIGREVNDQEAEQFARMMQGREQQFVQQAQTQSGGTIEELPSLETAAEQFVQEIAPTEANGYKFLGYADQFFGALRGRF